ncbi:molybdopterin cofactor-binding domain-containing protein [Gilvimarinus sp. F26214L]|uniref:molybdopterin cofactor-binding domain-containing protein n=1 Tax=Gilvimarinus sp. DZF01 TaxID=3461371 RepID=UPI004045C805
MKITRRKLLIGGGLLGGGLILGFSLAGDKPVPQTAPGSFQPNAWLQITPDGKVIFQLDKAEMGQGVYTGLTTLMGEALDFDPSRIQVEMAGVHSAYNNPAMRMQVTGGSTSLTTAWQPLQEAGASARRMLMQAAAQQMNVPLDDLTTDDGVVVYSASGRRLSYGELADAAKTQPLPDNAPLKAPGDYKWIGKSLPRFDTPAKVDGTARFGVDVTLPGMKVAVVIRCPQFGGTLQSFDASRALEMPGVQKVFAIHNGVAVVADGYWQARQAASQVGVEWNPGPLDGLSSADIRRNQEQALDSAETIVEALAEGDADGAWEQAGQTANTLEAIYAAPYLHHSTMEPQNCTAWAKGDHCEIWAPSQAPGFVQALAAQFGGFDPDKITVHTTLMGGGFGRRAMTDFAGEAAAIASQMPDVPVKLIWSREDDMQHDFYRPATVHRLRAVLDEEGTPVAWRHRLVSASITKGMAVTLVSSYLPAWLPEAMARGIGRFAGNATAGRDTAMAEGAEVPYAVANKKVDVALYDPGIPLGYWRSVGHSHNAFVVESFIDELAHAAGQDPVAYRRRYLQNHPRHLGVLEAVTRAADWDTPAPGRWRGVAVHESFSSYAAQVVEVSRSDSGYRIERVVCAVDCGRMVNPGIVEEQVESGILYGLSAALKPALNIENGAVVQSNFHDLPVLRMDETPEIEVVLVPSDEHPTGIGEIAVPPIAPALANALFQASGERQRELPLKLA